MASGRKSGSVVWSYLKFAPVEDDIFTPRFIRRQLAAYAAENQLTQTADSLHWWQANEAKILFIDSTCVQVSCHSSDIGTA